MSNESVASFLGPGGIRRIAADIGSVSVFPSARFIRLASNGIGTLSLFARANHIASVLDDVLRMPFPSVARILVDASGAPRREPGYGPMENFRFLAFTRLISRNGISHLPESMTALKELTRRFTSEFDVRPFLLSAEANTLRILSKWVDDEDFHVRRLVSESTRSRLPWGVHLESFKRNPTKIAPLIESLNTDSSRYVRISVANNLADIIKDNPEYGLSMAERWAVAAHPFTSKLLHHAVRFPAKRGDKRALALRILKN
jgi:3-methyladenine DNA glycosylase AlkC